MSDEQREPTAGETSAGPQAGGKVAADDKSKGVLLFLVMLFVSITLILGGTVTWLLATRNPSPSEDPEATPPSTAAAETESPSDNRLQSRGQPQDLAALREEYQRELRRQQSELQKASASISESIGQISEFADQLSQLAKTYPKAETAASFRQVSIEAPLWKAAMEWSRLLQAVSGERMSKLSPAKAVELLNEAERLSRSASIEPYSGLFEQSREHIVRIASRVDLAGTRIDEGLDKFLSEPVFGELYLIEDKQGRQYYLPTQEKPRRDGKIAFDYIIDRNLKTKPHIMRNEDVRFRGKSPLGEIAQWVRAELRGSKDLLTTGWETVFCRLIAAISEDTKVDPLPKLAILSRLLIVASQGSEAINLAFRRHHRLLVEDAASIDSLAKWFSPRDSAGRHASEQAGRILARLGQLPSVKAACQSASATSSPLQDADVATAWMGWLRKTEIGEWEAAFQNNDGTALNGFLHIVSRDSDLAVRCVHVGQIQNGALRWKTGSDQALLEGRPLFLTQAARDAAE